MRNNQSTIRRVLLILLFVLLAALGYRYHALIAEKALQLYGFLLDREKIVAYVDSFGISGPVVLIGIQFLQVLFAPLPGEATGGFIGGYLFGTIEGLFYTSLGLAAGSIAAFAIGRFLGNRIVRRLIPGNQMDKLDTLVKHQGIFVLFLLFIIPGFPKDYLCLFLGITVIPFRVFLLITILGRLPGTFFWSLQGEFAYHHHYGLLVAVLIPFICLGIVAYFRRHKLYQWIEGIGEQQHPTPMENPPGACKQDQRS